MTETGRQHKPEDFVDPKTRERLLKEKAARDARKNAPEQLKSQETEKTDEEYARELGGMMRGISEQVNKEVLAKYGLKDFLNTDNSLNMDGYAGDPHTAKQVQEDKELVHKMEMEFSKANVLSVRQNCGARTPEERLKIWKKDKNKAKNGLMEMAVTGLFHKILKEDFLVVRSAAIDDYDKDVGVDNIIINKRTGEAICAFDEVHEGGRGERTEEKIKKIKKVAAHGGVRVRYGIKMEKGKLKRAEMTTLPVFYLGLKQAELTKLLKKMDFNPDSAVTPEEYEVFAKLTASLKEQKQILDGTDAPFAVRNKLEIFENLLEEFEDLAQLNNSSGRRIAA